MRYNNLNNLENDVKTGEKERELFFIISYIILSYIN